MKLLQLQSKVYVALSGTNNLVDTSSHQKHKQCQSKYGTNFQNPSLEVNQKPGHFKIEPNRFIEK